MNIKCNLHYGVYYIACVVEFAQIIEMDKCHVRHTYAIGNSCPEFPLMYKITVTYMFLHIILIIIYYLIFLILTYIILC